MGSAITLHLQFNLRTLLKFRCNFIPEDKEFFVTNCNFCGETSHSGKPQGLTHRAFWHQTVNGTTGEGIYSLTVGERMEIAEAWIKHKDKIPHIVIQVGGTNFEEAKILVILADYLHVIHVIICSQEMPYNLFSIRRWATRLVQQWKVDMPVLHNFLVCRKHISCLCYKTLWGHLDFPKITNCKSVF